MQETLVRFLGSLRRDRLPIPVFLGFLCGSAGKESTCNEGDLGSIPGLGRSPGEGKGYPLQYSGLEKSMDCIAHGVTKSQTQLSNFDFLIQVVPFVPPGAFIPRCNEEGYYKATQCHGSTGQCWCVDKYGNELAGSRKQGAVNCGE